MVVVEQFETIIGINGADTIICSDRPVPSPLLSFWLFPPRMTPASRPIAGGNAKKAAKRHFVAQRLFQQKLTNP